MAKKDFHKSNVGAIVTFKFLTGEVLTGNIINQTFKENGIADYKIKVENSKGFTIYPCMTHERIIKRNKTALAVMNAADGGKKKSKKKIDNKELNDAIDAQKKFLDNA